jgi:hypothetical protein
VSSAASSSTSDLTLSKNSYASELSGVELKATSTSIAAASTFQLLKYHRHRKTCVITDIHIA